MNHQRWMADSSTGQLHCGLYVCIIATLVAISVLFSRFPAPAVRSRLLLISAMCICYWSFQASECFSCRSVDVYACHGAEVFRLFHFVKALEARMLNCPRKFGLTFFIDCMVMLCVRAFQNCIIANISTRFAALSHPRQLAFKFQRSLQLAIDRFCHGLLSFLQLEFHSILLLVWLSYLQLDFNRSCHWCAQLFTA